MLGPSSTMRRQGLGESSIAITQGHLLSAVFLKSRAELDRATTSLCPRRRAVLTVPGRGRRPSLPPPSPRAFFKAFYRMGPKLGTCQPDDRARQHSSGMLYLPLASATPQQPHTRLLPLARDASRGRPPASFPNIARPRRCFFSPQRGQSPRRARRSHSSTLLSATESQGRQASSSAYTWNQMN